MRRRHDPGIGQTGRRPAFGLIAEKAAETVPVRHA